MPPLIATFLIAITITTQSGTPIPHARLSCSNLIRHVEGPVEAEDENNGSGAVLMTDSRGRMIIETDAHLYSCRAWAPGYPRIWVTLNVLGPGQSFTIRLTPAP